MKLLAGLIVLAAATAIAQPTGKPTTRLPIGVERFDNLAYARYDTRVLTLDLLVPEGDGPHPGVLVVHGGGWQNGDKTKFRALCNQLAARGYVAACVGYRLSREARFPAALHDLKAAVRWMRANAEKYKIDAEHIGALGGSAGGHLVGVLATSSQVERLEGDGGNPEESSAIQAAIVLGGGVDLAAPFVDDPNRPAPNARIFFGATYAENPALYAEASASTHLDSHTPPVLFMDCENDRPGERYVAMREKMDELGISNELFVTDGGKHGCWNNHPWFQPMLEKMTDFFSWTLKTTATSD